MNDFNIISGTWTELASYAERIRREVFIQEQNIAEQDEWDAQDQISQHFVVYTIELGKAHAIATARLLANNSIGRVAVLKSHRGQGIGRLLMLKIIDQAKIEQRTFLKLSAQVHAIAFYQSLGFSVQGTEYLDCGIPHVDMTLSL